MPTLTVYNLGEKGCNVVKSPVHLEDGELTSAQNAVFNPEGEEGGLQKRGGLTALNGTALPGGAVKGLIAVPFPDTDDLTTTLYAAMGTADANTWYASTNGTTWTAGTTPGDAAGSAKLVGMGQYYGNRVATLGGKLYYPANGYTQYESGVTAGTPPVLSSYDGTDDRDTCTIPYNPIAGTGTNAFVILDEVVHRGALYLSCYDPGGVAPDHRGRVFKLDPETGALTQVGNRFGAGTGEADGGMPISLASYNGFLWAGTYGISGGAVGHIYRIRPDFDESWTEDHTTTAGQGYILSMAGYQGKLYAATTGDAGSEALVLVRSTAGTWTTSFTGSTTTGGHYLTSLTVFNDTLFAAEVDDGAGAVCLIKAFDGTSWSTDLDVEATYSIKDSGQTLVYNDALYWVFVATGAGLANADGFILKRTTAGVWTQPLDAANTRGYLGKVVA